MTGWKNYRKSEREDHGDKYFTYKYNFYLFEHPIFGKFRTSETEDHGNNVSIWS